MKLQQWRSNRPRKVDPRRVARILQWRLLGYSGDNQPCYSARVQLDSLTFGTRYSVGGSIWSEVAPVIEREAPARPWRKERG